MSRNAMRKSTFIIMFIAVGLLVWTGCGKDGAPRQKLSGRVTFNGQPVPVGLIVFEPDASKGGKGPQGYAEIIDGQYTTDKLGKGAITGPLKIQISGFPANDGTSANPDVPLFPPYKTEVNLTENMQVLDFDVPLRRR